MSRALTILIRLKHMVKLTNTQLIRPPGLVINRCLGPLQSFKIQAMSTVSDEDLKDPKRHLDFKQFIERKDKENVYVIDVREYSEVKETGKIPGSINIPFAELGKALGGMSEEEFKKHYSALKPPKDAEIIFSCKLGGRSLKALKLALELGFKNSKNFKGGWLDWVKNTQSSS